MNFKLKMIAAGAAMVVAGGASAATAPVTTVENFMSGNSSLSFIALDYTGSPISVFANLDYHLDSFLPSSSTTSAAGTKIVWDFKNNTLTVNGVAKAGAATNWSSAFSNFYATAQNSETKWGVIAGDSLSTSGSTTPIRYLTTSVSPLATVQNQTKANLSGWAGSDLLINANGLLQTDVNGANASTATSGQAYVGQTFGTAGTWQNKAGFSALAAEGVSQSFYELDGVNGISTTKALATQYAGTFSYAAGKLTYTVPAAPVPEPETYAMLLAGLGMLGFMARRRLANRA